MLIGWDTKKNDVERMTRKILYQKIYTRRVRGVPKLRWFDDVTEDLRILKVEDWRSTATDRDACRLLVQKNKAHNRL
jgi:hypothetical protein